MEKGEEGKGPATAGAGRVKSSSSKCVDEPLSELSLARWGGGSGWCARTFLLGSLPPASVLPAISIWPPPQGYKNFCAGYLWPEMMAHELSCWVAFSSFCCVNEFLKDPFILPYFTIFRGFELPSYLKRLNGLLIPWKQSHHLSKEILLQTASCWNQSIFKKKYGGFWGLSLGRQEL